MSKEDRTLVDAETSVLIDALPMVDLDHDNLLEARRLAEVDPSLFDAALEPLIVRLERPDGTFMRALLFDPPGKFGNRGAILHLHGGGMVFGSPEMARLSMPRLALDHSIAVLSIDYRLAPESVFPNQLDDAAIALAWLEANADRLAIDPTRIFAMGESAGGGLVAGLALRLRDQGAQRMAGLLLTYPMLDARTGAPNDPYDHGPAGNFIWTRVRNQFGWQALRGGQSLDAVAIGWYSPQQAASLADLPPTFIATGSLDLFRAENLAFAERLASAGVPSELHMYAGAIHGFDLLHRSRLAKRYRNDMSAWLENALKS